MPGPAEGQGQIPDAPVPIRSPILGGCWVQVSSWLPLVGGARPAQALPAPACRRSYRTVWLWAAWPLSHQLLHLPIFGFAATLAPPSWLDTGALRSVVASIPPSPCMDIHSSLCLPWLVGDTAAARGLARVPGQQRHVLR